jgi:hypothetical protein
MPYKDQERKRKWEREHREERNARRRKSTPIPSRQGLDVDAPLPDPNSAQVPLTNTHFAIGGMMGLALLLTVLILAMRHLRSSPGPRHNYPAETA